MGALTESHAEAAEEIAGITMIAADSAAASSIRALAVRSG
jgi:hypothetical protein